MPMMPQQFQMILPAEHPVRVARLQQCQICPESFIGALGGALMGEKARRCRICKCFVYAKTRVRFAHCPIGKW